jgi:antitoxin component YwqK of YwqJK toxin-antitoxin module
MEKLIVNPINCIYLDILMELNLIPQVIRNYYPGDNGNLFEEYFQLNGKKEGEYKSYYDNGRLYIICNYINGLKEGEYKQYYSNGNLWTVHHYLSDKKEG